MNRAGPYGPGVSYEAKRRGFKKYRARMFRNGAVDLGRYATAGEARQAVQQARRLLRYYRQQAAAASSSDEQQQQAPSPFSVPPLAYPKVFKAVQSLITAQPHLLTQPADDDEDQEGPDYIDDLPLPMDAHGYPGAALAAMHAAAALDAHADAAAAMHAAASAAAAAHFGYAAVAADALPISGLFAQQPEVEAAPYLSFLQQPHPHPQQQHHQQQPLVFAPQAAAPGPAPGPPPAAAAAAAASPAAAAGPAGPAGSQEDEDATLLHSFLDMMLDHEPDPSEGDASASASASGAASVDSNAAAAAAVAAGLLPVAEMAAHAPAVPAPLQLHHALPDAAAAGAEQGVMVPVPGMPAMAPAPAPPQGLIPVPAAAVGAPMGPPAPPAPMGPPAAAPAPMGAAVPSTFLGLSTAYELLMMADSCVQHILDLYVKLLPLHGMPSGHARVVLVQWLAGARVATISNMHQPPMVQHAVMQLLSKLVQLLTAAANTNGTLYMPLLGGMATNAGCELVLPVVERLMRSLEQLKLLCSSSSNAAAVGGGLMDPGSAGSTVQVWFGQMLQQQALPGDYIVHQLVQQLAA